MKKLAVISIMLVSYISLQAMDAPDPLLTELNKAVADGDAEQVMQVLNKGGVAYIDGQEGFGVKPLNNALMHPQIVQILLQHGATPEPDMVNNIINAIYFTPDKKERYLKSLRILLEHGAQISQEPIHSIDEDTRELLKEFGQEVPE